MDYAVLLTDLTVPTREQLVAAFEHLPSLTRMDAIRRARQVCGFVAENLAHEDAMALMGGLAEQNLGAAIVPMAELPVLIQPYRLRELRVETGALTVFDVMQRSREVAWLDVQVLALGWVSSIKFERRGVGFHAEYPFADDDQMVVMTETTEREQVTPILEIHLVDEAGGGRSRLVAETDRIMQRRDAGEVAEKVADRYAELLRGLAGYAQTAVVNRGMDGFLGQAEQVKYATRTVFEREIVWLKWLAGL